MSVTVNNSAVLDYDHPNDYEMTPGFEINFPKTRNALLTVHMAFLYMPSYIKPIIILASLSLKMQIYN